MGEPFQPDLQYCRRLDQLVHHPGMRHRRIGQRFLTPVMRVLQPVVVQPQLVQDGGQEVGAAHPAVDGGVAQVVGAAVYIARFEAAAGEIRLNALRLWSRPFPRCEIGKRPNSPVQRTMVESSSPRCFKSRINAAVGTSTCGQRASSPGLMFS